MFASRTAWIASICAAAVALVHSDSHQMAPALIGVPYHASGIYSVGEKVGWTLTLPPGASAPNGKYSYSLKRNDNLLAASGELDLSSGKATLEFSQSQEDMIYLEITPPGGGRAQAFGAAIAPTKIQPVATRPRDFDRFWRSKIADLEKIPANPAVTPGDGGNADVEYGTIQMDHVNGTHVYGQIAKPKRPGKYPALLILQWASPPYPLQKSWVVDRAKEGWLALNIEPHDVLPTEPPAYYRNLPAQMKHYESVGYEDRDKSFFVEMYLRDYRAVDYLTQRPDWDGKTLVVMGGSMGGQQSLCVAGLHPKITHVIVEEPAGCDLQAGLHGREEGYPFFPTNNPKVMAAAPYVDAVNFAPHIRAKSLVAMGFIDTVAPPCGIWTAFNEIRGPKEAAPMVDAAHNNIATFEQQRPYYDRMGAWLSELVKGQPLDLRSQVGAKWASPPAMGSVPVVETERLILRGMTSADAADIFAVGGDDCVMRFYDLDTFPGERAAAEFIAVQQERFEAGLAVRWGIELKELGIVVGWCGFTPGLQRRAEVGYVLAARHWGKGLATEAVRKVVSYAFSNTEVNRLEAVTHPPNVASARVLEKCGFRQEGLMRQYGFWRGEFHDMFLHARLRSDLCEF